MRRHKLQLAIRSLDVGGAERQLLEILKQIDQALFDVTVVALRPGSLDHELEGTGIRLRYIGGARRRDLRAIFRWRQLLAEAPPEVIYSFLIDMNLLAALVRAISPGRPKLIWGIFGSEPDFKNGPRFERMIYRLLQLLESRADLITSDSYRGFEFLASYGFRLRNSAVIHSGTNTERFYRDEVARAQFRRQHCLPENAIAIGICSRLVHMKGYHLLAVAAKRILERRNDVWFFAAGGGRENIVVECKTILGAAGNRFVWLGRVAKTEICLSGWDLYCSSSLYGEGFSNAIIEAMACELPCVVTDVGDARRQVGDTGIVVEPKSEQALYDGLSAMLAQVDRRERGSRARQRVLDNFTKTSMVRRTEQSILNMIDGAKRERWTERTSDPVTGHPLARQNS